MLEFVFILLGIFFLWTVVQLVLLILRENKIHQLIKSAGKDDPFWNKEEMLSLAEETFVQVQYAWSKNKFTSIAPILTDKLKNEWLDVWESLQKQNLKFHCGASAVHEVQIIGMEDYMDDSLDHFTVEISARVKRYVYKSSTMQLAPHYVNDLHDVVDIYQFIREDNLWKLNEIKYNKGYMNLTKYTIKKEGSNE